MVNRYHQQALEHTEEDYIYLSAQNPSVTEDSSKYMLLTFSEKEEETGYHALSPTPPSWE